MRSSPFELEVDAPAEPLSMAARGAAERCCAQLYASVHYSRCRAASLATHVRFYASLLCLDPKARTLPRRVVGR